MRRHDHSSSTLSELFEVPGFRGCTPKQLAHVERLTERLTVPRGHVLVREGMLGREFFVVLHGLASVTRRGQLVSTLEPGDSFGELNAIEAGRRAATITALSDLTLLVIGPRQFAALMADVPGFREVVLRTLASRLRAADDIISEIEDWTVETEGGTLAEVAELPVS
jgi:CRP-like cAMP-binding protein